METIKVDRRNRVKKSKGLVFTRKAKTDSDWEAEIAECLNSKGNSADWGCLSRAGGLFKIKTLSTYTVPMRVIRKMEQDGRIVIAPKDLHYSYIKNKNQN